MKLTASQLILIPSVAAAFATQGCGGGPSGTSGTLPSSPAVSESHATSSVITPPQSSSGTLSGSTAVSPENKSAKAAATPGTVFVVSDSQQTGKPISSLNNPTDRWISTDAAKQSTDFVSGDESPSAATSLPEVTITPHDTSAVQDKPKQAADDEQAVPEPSGLLTLSFGAVCAAMLLLLAFRRKPAR